MHAERVRGWGGESRGGGDDYNSSGVLWDHAGVDAKLGFGRISSLARWHWTSTGRRRFGV